MKLTSFFTKKGYFSHKRGKRSLVLDTASSPFFSQGLSFPSSGSRLWSLRGSSCGTSRHHPSIPGTAGEKVKDVLQDMSSLERDASWEDFLPLTGQNWPRDYPQLQGRLGHEGVCFLRHLTRKVKGKGVTMPFRGNPQQLPCAPIGIRIILLLISHFALYLPTPKSHVPVRLHPCVCPVPGHTVSWVPPWTHYFIVKASLIIPMLLSPYSLPSLLLFLLIISSMAVVST